MCFLRSSLLLSAGLLASTIPAMPVLAADAADAAASPPQDHVHPQEDADIVVTAAFTRERFALPAAVTVVEGEQLLRNIRPTIGETLAAQPGVSASFFGPNASRPILRGMDSERVRVLTDGIGSFDLSNASADHAVATNPLTTDRIEVVRGPAALLYGSSAIGGVVNMSDRRIPRQVPPDAVHLDVQGSLGSAAEERALAGSADVPLGESGMVAHVDGSATTTGDYRAGGYLFAGDLRRQAAEIGGEVAEQAMARGRVSNSDASNRDVGAGLAYVGDTGSIGVAISHLNSNYGIPNRLALHDPAHDHDHADEGDDDHGHAEEDVRIDMRQTRVDARSELSFDGFFSTLKGRFGWADYRHDELEGDGTIGTRFFNQGLEGRLELVQADHGGWQGASGVQYMHRRVMVTGEEAILPHNLTDQFGLFTVQSVKLGRLSLEAGARFEHSAVSAPELALSRGFSSFSGSVGASVKLREGWQLSASVSHSERAPSAEELLVDGAHPATGSYELGDRDLRLEKSLGVEAVLRGRGPGWNVELSGFFSRFSNYLYLAPTGGERDGLPLFVYRQARARYYGAEASASVTIAQSGETSFLLSGLADYVRADILDGGGPVPRIPPLRMQAAIEATGGVIGGRLEAEHVTAATRLADFETATPAYTMVNASVSWRPLGADRPIVLIAAIDNLFDVEARRHASFLKDYAPLPGRDFRLTAQFSF